MHGDTNYRMFEFPIPVWQYAVYIQNYIMGVHNNFGPQILTPTWSLAVEEQFYLIFPFLIYFIKPRFYYLLFLALVIVAIFSRIIVHGNFYKYYTWLPSRIDSLAVGGLLAWVKINWWPQFFEKHLRQRYNLSKMILVLLFLTMILLPNLVNIDISLKFSVVALAFGLLVLLVLEFDFIKRLLENSIIIFIGKISYGMYIYHQIINHVLHKIIFNSDPAISNMNNTLVTGLSFFLTIFVSYFSFRYFERPLMNRGHRLTYKFSDGADSPAVFQFANVKEKLPVDKNGVKQ